MEPVRKYILPPFRNTVDFFGRSSRSTKLGRPIGNRNFEFQPIRSRISKRQKKPRNMYFKIIYIFFWFWGHFSFFGKRPISKKSTIFWNGGSTNKAKIPHSCFSALNMVGRARWSDSAFLSRFSKQLHFWSHILSRYHARPLKLTNREQTLALISFPHKCGNWIGWLHCNCHHWIWTVKRCCWWICNIISTCDRMDGR